MFRAGPRFEKSVVAAILPSLLLLSGMREYSWFRLAGALFAGVASAGWIAERVLNIRGPVDFVVDGVAHRAVWLAAGLFVASMLFWRLEKIHASGIALQEGSE